MDDLETGSGPEPEVGEDSEPAEGEGLRGRESSSGVVGFLTSLRGLVSTFAALVLALGGLITALNQAGVIGGGSGTNGTTTVVTSGLFAPVTRPNGRVYYDGELLYVRASSPARPMLHLADQDEPLADMSIGGLVEWVSGASDYGFGFVCRYQSADNYYLLSVLSGGRYNIVRYRDGKPVSLTGGFQEGAPVPDGPYDVYSKCVGEGPTRLTLTVNGVEAATAVDPDGIESGTFGLRVGTGESFVVVRLDRLELRHL